MKPTWGSGDIQFTFGSLFAGIGGIDLGLERAGMTCKWQVEIDDYCQRVLAKHWSDVRRYEDVRDCGTHNLEPVDLICGGFPCQPHSVAGKRKGAADDRNLWPEFARIVAELHPRYILAENVPGITSTYLDTVLSDLEGEDYACATFNFPACAFDAPHRRERIFVVAYGDRARQLQSKGSKPQERERPSYGCEDVPHSVALRRDGRQDDKGQAQAERDGAAKSGADVADADVGTRERSITQSVQRPISHVAKRERHQVTWLPEPSVGRVAHGVPHRVDRLRALGNAVVPQVAEWFGERIMEAQMQPRLEGLA